MKNFVGFALFLTIAVSVHTQEVHSIKRPITSDDIAIFLEYFNRYATLGKNVVVLFEAHQSNEEGIYINRYDSMGLTSIRITQSGKNYGSEITRKTTLYIGIYDTSNVYDNYYFSNITQNTKNQISEFIRHLLYNSLL